MVKQTPKKTRSWLMLFIALIFLLIGGALLAYLVIPNINDYLRMQFWQSTDATVLSGGLETSHSSDSTSYSAYGHYRYSVDDNVYENNRVSIFGGSDNIGSFQQDLGARIEQAHKQKKPLEIWYDPDNPQDSIVNRQMRWGQTIFLSVFGLIFFGVGLLLFKVGWSSEPDMIDTGEYAQQPWLQKKEWRDNSIRSDAKTIFVFALVFAGFWNLISTPVLFFFPETYEEEGAVAFIMLLFPLVGLGLILWAISAFRQWRKFGVTILEMDPFPGAIGGDVGGRIKIKIPYEPKQLFKVTLSCMHSYTSGSGKNRSTTQKVKWQRDGYAHISRHVDGIVVNFRFEVPAGLPETEPSSSSYHFWKLSVVAQMKGVNFNRDFDIPVYQCLQTSEARIDLSTDHRPSAAPKMTLDSLLPVAPGSRDREIYYGYFNQPGNILVGILFGGIFAGIGGVMLYFAFDEGMVLYIVGGIFSLIGWMIVLLSIYSAITSRRLIFDGKQLTSKTKLLGITISHKQLRYSQIKSVEIKEGAQTQSGNKHSFTYTLNAVGGDQTITLAENVRSNQELDFLKEYFEQEFFGKGPKLVL